LTILEEIICRAKIFIFVRSTFDQSSLSFSYIQYRNKESGRRIVFELKFWASEWHNCSQVERLLVRLQFLQVFILFFLFMVEEPYKNQDSWSVYYFPKERIMKIEGPTLLSVLKTYHLTVEARNNVNLLKHGWRPAE
jgi:hypothetical protein